jgi:hypothetical protein
MNRLLTNPPSCRKYSDDVHDTVIRFKQHSGERGPDIATRAGYENLLHEWSPVYL